MHRFVEIYYLAAIPVTLLAVAGGLYFPKLRMYLLLSAMVILAGWTASIEHLSRRSDLIENYYAQTSAELLSVLGEPDYSHQYPEGDSEWRYVIRVSPWKGEVGYGVYREHIQFASRSGGLRDDINFFYSPKYWLRSEAESKRMRADLARYDQWIDKDAKEKHPPEPTPGAAR